MPARQLGQLFAPHLEGMDAALLGGVRLSASVLHDVPAPMAALPRAAASNNWVVAPSRSARGDALLANDPHLEVNRLPQLVYEAQIVAGTPTARQVAAVAWVEPAEIPALKLPPADYPLARRLAGLTP